MRYGFIMDQDRCIGCHACTVACKEEHQVPVGVFRTWVKYIEKGEFPYTRRHFAVLRCNHCDDAPCVEICPTIALFRRSDGIVDFDGERCIGCKSCMQACPYDALYIDPNTNTAAKCNFCAHRVEVGLEPACVIVCPTQAIISSDLDDPASPASQIVATQKVTVRKPEKGTRPKLFYVGVDGDLLQPTRVAPQGTYFWAEKLPGENLFLPEEKKDQPSPDEAREVYDIAHPQPWGRKIASYLWTKSIAAGMLLVAALLLSMGYEGEALLLNLASPLLALLFLGITTLLLIFDLKRPERFFYLLSKPNLRSWLVLGSYVLIFYGLLAFLWLFFSLIKGSVPGVLLGSTAILAAGSAGYSAFLFAQAKGRDFWQSPLFLWHLLVQAATAGAATLILVGILFRAGPAVLEVLGRVLSLSLFFSLGMTLGEVFLTPVSEDVKRATNLLKRGALRRSFWGLGVFLGMVLPLLLLFGSGLWGGVFYGPYVLAAAFSLAGLWVFEDLWVRAGQAVPLS